MGRLATTDAVHAQACTAENAAVCDGPALLALGDDLYDTARYGEAVGVFFQGAGYRKLPQRRPSPSTFIEIFWDGLETKK